MKHPKLSATVRNLLDSQLEPPIGTDRFHCGNSLLPRMVFGPPCAKSPVTDEQVIHVIRTQNPPDTVFYLDTNFFTGREKPWPLWQALLGKQIAVTPLVWQELQPWLERPFRNRRMRDYLLDARICRPPHVIFDPAGYWNPLHSLACDYFINLLAVRKRLGSILFRDFATKQGRDPTEEEFNRMIQAAGGEHEFHLIRKGKTDIEKETFFADEQLVATAVCDTIINRRESTILTTDTDVLEQFAKLLHIIDVQYQAMLFAERFCKDASSFDQQPMIRSTPELQHYFRKDGLLVRKPSGPGRAFVEWLLPERYVSTVANCLLFGGDKESLVFTPILYNTEADMVRLLKIKGRTGGMNTDLLGASNCHVTGFPVGVPEPRRWVIIAEDNTIDVEVMRYSIMDVAHASAGRSPRYIDEDIC